MYALYFIRYALYVYFIRFIRILYTFILYTLTYAEVVGSTFSYKDGVVVAVVLLCDIFHVFRVFLAVPC